MFFTVVVSDVMCQVYQRERNGVKARGLTHMLNQSQDRCVHRPVVRSVCSACRLREGEGSQATPLLCLC